MEKQDIFNYILSTPNNTNPQILSLMLDKFLIDNKDKSPEIYYEPELTLEDFLEQNSEEIAPFSLIVVQSKEDSENMELYYLNPATGELEQNLKLIGSGIWDENEDGSIILKTTAEGLSEQTEE